MGVGTGRWWGCRRLVRSVHRYAGEAGPGVQGERGGCRVIRCKAVSNGCPNNVCVSKCCLRNTDVGGLVCGRNEPLLGLNFGFGFKLMCSSPPRSASLGGGACKYRGGGGGRNCTSGEGWGHRAPGALVLVAGPGVRGEGQPVHVHRRLGPEPFSPQPERAVIAPPPRVGALGPKKRSDGSFRCSVGATRAAPRRVEPQGGEGGIR